MRWLQWSPHDLSYGLGGVEVHARSVHRELLGFGVDSHLSSDPHRLDDSWDVIQTHGCGPLPEFSKRKAIRVHTLHGTTLGRVSACREWLWPGGYLAYGKEGLGVVRGDVILGVHPGIHLLSLARLLGKKTAVCWNGWDSGQAEAGLPLEFKSKLDQFGSFFCFVGRGDDPVKNTPWIEKILKSAPQMKLVAIPGEGFKASEQILTSGLLNPSQIISVLRRSLGLLLCSHYEGLPLVVLEALGWGIPVYTTEVGGLSYLSRELQGLHLLPLEESVWKSALSSAKDLQGSVERREWNRKLIPSWKEVARTVLEGVREVSG